ncbi:nucleoside diphosphate kinase 7 isoform a [Ectocarpus siliculosus]|uniref:Nucleoside diphosphate kinase 7 isoform a n=1 Tax=Ectocarpus siliculosus TaxID=2880 RepID=D8LIS4_ECTSI|nr:nucleoside diphosphate kinase 7 isoform a [Ectocarpus siliculosus]|eukprot:CBN79447.1 nucleoside diphosphate kinase 7 isoform a [Ectocarpus siliculosus]
MTSTNAPALFPKPVGFSVEYFDPVAKSLRSFVLTVFPDRKVQMVCGNKTFLSKTYAKDLVTTDLYIGGTVVLFSRELSIVDYADESTRKYYESTQTRGFVVVLPSMVRYLGDVISCLQDGGGCEGNRRCPSVISNAKMFRLEGREKRRSELPVPDIDMPQSGAAVALEVILDSRDRGFEGLLGVVEKWREREGGVFASSTPAQAAEDARQMFQSNGGGVEQQPADDNGERACTLCVVKPHIVRDGKLGGLLALVSERGFEVTGMQMMHLGEVGAEELLRPYRGVVSYHADAVRHLKSGNCVALRLEKGEDVVEEFREACGPADPEVARALYPDTLRALLGVQQATNAVHCTDLPEDGLLECQYMFGVLAKDRQGA